MKKIITVLFVATATLFCYKAFAQDITVTAGYEQPSFSGSGYSINLNGFYAGVLTQIPLNGVFYLEPGAIFDWGKKDNLKLSHLRVPLHIGTSLDLGNDFDLFASAGPGLNIGLFGSDNVFDIYNRFDIILGLEAGVRMSDQYELRFGYDWGLLKAAKEGNAHHNVLHIGLAYKF